MPPDRANLGSDPNSGQSVRASQQSFTDLAKPQVQGSDPNLAAPNLPGQTLGSDIDFDRRFGALARLYGVIGAQRIAAAHVVVVGIGGVGSWAAEALARSGVGRLTLIDLDHVSVSNINRQIQAVEASLGQAKVLAMRDRILSFHPACVVNCIEEFVTPENWPALLPVGVNAVICLLYTSP